MEKIRQVPVDDIVKQYETLRELVKKHAAEDQVANILSMFDDFEERITSSPASGRLNYHNCFVGGFLDHVLRVQETAFKCKSLLKSMDIKINCSDSDDLPHPPPSPSQGDTEWLRAPRRGFA